MTTKTESLPKLETYPPYAEVLSRHKALSDELRTVVAEKESLSEFAGGKPLSDIDLEALRLATPERDPAVRKAYRSAERFRELSHREAVLRKALEMVEPVLTQKREEASRKLAAEVFTNTFRPAVRVAGEKLLTAVRELIEVAKLHGAIAMAELASGPCYSMPFHVDTEGRLNPRHLIESLEHGGFITREEALKYRAQFPTA